MSNRNKTPLFVFGTAEDLTGWNTFGTPVVTGSQTDPLGGSDASLVDDNDGAGLEYIYSDNVSLTANVDGEAVVNIFLKAGSATATVVRLYDATAAAERVEVRASWAGGVPTLAVIGGAGTLFTPILCGNAWYLIRFSATSIVTGNNHRLEIRPAGSTAANTGTVYAFVRSAVTPGLFLDEALTWPSPREGSEIAKSAAGTEDAWIIGTDQFLRGNARWIPTVDVDSPQTATGWDGRREDVWANVGWASFLTFGRAKTTFVFVPDQSDCTTYQTVYLIEPGPQDPVPRLEDADKTRTLTLVIRDSSDLPFEGY